MGKLELLLERMILTDKSTIGKLYINGEFFCYTLEDVDRHLEIYPDVKVYGKTAIPRGSYVVTYRYSPHFAMTLPYINDVPGFEYVMFHWGNKPEDTDGCILVGDSYADDWISHSRATFSKLMRYIDDAMESGDQITLEIV